MLILFVATLLAATATRFWLGFRQIRAVAAHRAAVPAEFAAKVSLAAHQTAADYTIARVKLALIEAFVDACWLIVLTLLGGLQWLNQTLLGWLGNGLAWGVALIGALTVASSVIALPFGLYRQFVIEQRFGFNRMTVRLWLLDLLKSTLLSAVLGVPLLLAVLALMQHLGDRWWLWTWLVWSGFNLLLLGLYPTVIAPLFNKFTPLADGELKHQIEALLARCGFATSGLFVMDGSRRSAHGNAYFTGFGRAKRIVFFDTLIDKLTPNETCAVLAHELGHFVHRDVHKRIVLTFAASFALLALLGWLATQTWFYLGLGVAPLLGGSNAPLALALFFVALPVFSYFTQPLLAAASRRQEFAADAFAIAQSDAQALTSALVKLYQDNAATLTPDPLHSAFYDSHPGPSIRIAQIQRVAQGQQ